MLQSYLKPGDGVIDIGANTGAYAISYAKIVGPTGMVLAVEPCRESYERLRGAVSTYPQIVCRHAAVSDRDGCVTELFHDSRDSKCHSRYQANLMQSAGTSETVLTVTLDTLAASVPHLAGIKIDAQGSERAILEGAADTLRRAGLVWFVEFWPEGLAHAGSSAEEVAQVFQHAGWSPVTMDWETAVKAFPQQQGHSSVDLVLARQT